MLPTLEHQLVDGRRTVHRSGEPERLVDGLHDLMKRREEGMGDQGEQQEAPSQPAQPRLTTTSCLRQKKKKKCPCQLSRTSWLLMSQ